MYFKGLELEPLLAVDTFTAVTKESCAAQTQDM